MNLLTPFWNWTRGFLLYSVSASTLQGISFVTKKRHKKNKSTSCFEDIFFFKAFYVKLQIVCENVLLIFLLKSLFPLLSVNDRHAVTEML